MSGIRNNRVIRKEGTNMHNQSANNSDKRVGVWILRLLILASFSGLLFGLWALRCAYNGNDWPKVRGTIIYSQMVGPTGHAKAKIRYNYIVGGHTYEGQYVSFADLFHIQMYGIKSIVARYPKGTRLWVYFDPENPKRAILEKDIRPELYWTPIGAFILLILGVFLYLRFRPKLG